MKIAITHPTNWPVVRRGAERFMNELGAYLVGRGHDVELISAHPGPNAAVPSDAGYVSHLNRSLWRPWMRAAGIRPEHTFFLNTLARLSRGGYDVVHACGHTDALAAITWRRLGGPPCVFWMNGAFSDDVRPNGIFARAVRGADAVIAPSRYIQEATEKRFGRRPVVVPVPVDTQTFKPGRNGRAAETILCASVLEEPRKGGALLFRAFDALKKHRPHAELHISSTVQPDTKERLFREVSSMHQGSIRFLGAGVVDDLPGIYAAASVTVLPAIHEAFGMVLPESMASGTPVVGAKHGAIPEIINNERVGALFDPGAGSAVEPTNLEGLVAALERGLMLSQRSETSAHCRSRAEELDWRTNGPVFEEIYGRILSRDRLAS